MNGRTRMDQRLDIRDIPELPGYLTVSAVAERYGMAKGSIYHMIYAKRRFKNVYKVGKGGHKGGKGGEDKRPLLLLATNEVDEVFAQRERPQVTDPDLSQKMNAWNKRVKQWAREQGWTQTVIRISGQPPKVMQQAYLQANPDDTRP